MEIVSLVQRCCLLRAYCAASSPSPPPSLQPNFSSARVRAHTHTLSLMCYSFGNHYGKYKGLQRIRKIADGLFSWAIRNAKYHFIKKQEYCFLPAFTVMPRVLVFATVQDFLSPSEINTAYRTKERQ